MRKVLYSVATSLDGFIARADGAFDWITIDPAMDWAGFMNRFDTVLMGRRTYEVAISHGPVGGSPNMRSYVFSTTLRASDHPSVTIVADDAARVVAELRSAPGKDIWLMGGGVLFRSLLDAGLVDEVEVGILPVLIGEGIPLLQPGTRTTRLGLKTHKMYPSGTLLLSYEVLRGAAPKRKSARARSRRR